MPACEYLRVLPAAEGTEPSSDTNASAEYRRHLAGVLVRRALQEACGSAGSLAAGGAAREARSRYELDLVGGEDGRSLGDECCDDGRLVVFAAEESHRRAAAMMTIGDSPSYDT